MGRQRYQNDLGRLNDELTGLHRMAATSLRRSVQALRLGDKHAASELTVADEDIDARQMAIENRALRIIALQQPVGRDLRLILMTVSVAGELERIGDYAKQIARRVRRLTQTDPALAAPPELTALGEIALRMVDGAIVAFLTDDVATARALAAEDDAADAAQDAVGRAVRAAVLGDARLFDAAENLLMIAHALERAADRATNIAERVVYLATAENEALNP